MMDIKETENMKKNHAIGSLISKSFCSGFIILCI